jgi:signal transduction histidine kinase
MRRLSPHSTWYRSFYWRIGVGFVVCVLAVLVAQSVIFGLIMARPSGMPGAMPGRSPNGFATMIAGDLEAALADSPGLDPVEYFASRSRRMRGSVFIVMKDGRVARTGRDELSESDRRAALDALTANEMPAPGPPPMFASLHALVRRPPAAMAPVRVGNDMRAVVVLPPPPVGGMMRDVGRMLTVPGVFVLVVITGLAAVFIFRPARQRLRGLEEAAARLGSGDLTARAPEQGGDEIARVARAFNRMTAELAARDEALRVSDRLRRQMLADVSHELNTPLTAMRGYLETLHMRDVTLDTGTRERYLETVERETRRLERIVKDLLDLARYENGAGKLDVRPFAVERLFAHVVQRHEHETKTRRIAMRVCVDETADQIVADPDRIENLVANALRHTPDGGTIDLRAASDGGKTTLAVTDSGEGIPPEHLAHVFERFYKADQSRHSPAAGSGLGLSIAKAIVEGHGGTVDVASEPGRTEFRIVLPNQSVSTNL